MFWKAEACSDKRRGLQPSACRGVVAVPRGFRGLWCGPGKRILPRDLKMVRRSVCFAWGTVRRRPHRVGVMHRVNERIAKRIAKQLAEFYEHRAEPDYEEQARLILLIVDQERKAEIREWRAACEEGARTCTVST